MTLRLLPAVLSGGSGTRLWPLSTDEVPKQFHALCSGQSMLQDTIARFAQSDPNIEVLPPIIIGGQRHGELMATQVAELGVQPLHIVLEPFGRNSAPAAAVAARLAEAHDPDALVILMAADHLIPDPAGFRAAVARSAQAAADHIVVFGVAPTSPETGYGYIEAGELIDGPARLVARYAEKPDLKTAEAYLASGRYLWNAGIFLFSPAVMLAELKRFAPDVLRAVDAALEAAELGGASIRLDERAFAECPSISIDYAVMEKTDRAAVTPIGVDWADVGSWSELWRQGPLDGRNNFTHGDALLIDADDSLVWAGSRTVGVIGVKDVIVVETEGAVIVLPKSRAQDVKLLVEQIKARRGK
jgi:mannose-1-phosphate guanylyltransferase/mannose-6-phosphate isomerase